MNQPLFKAVALGLMSIAIAASTLAQQVGGPAPSAIPNPMSGIAALPESTGTIIQLAVQGERQKPLDRQAVVQITNKATGQVQTRVTQDDSVATIIDLQTGPYDVAVSALGYLTSHQEVMISGLITVKRMEVGLKKDPSAVDLGAVNVKEIPSKVRRNLMHGLADLKSSKFDEAQKKLDAAYKADPSNPEVNFLLGYLYFEKQNMKQAQSYLTAATKLAPHYVEALTLLGRVELQRNDAAAAQGPLEQAVAAHPESWMAHYLLSDVYLQ